MVAQKQIALDEVSKILGLAESHFLDLKRIEISPAKLSESISAFGNTAGGELFIGIGESLDKSKRFWRGFDSMEAANGLFQVIDKMTPLATHYQATWLTSEGQTGYVLHLIVPKVRDI